MAAAVGPIRALNEDIRTLAQTKRIRVTQFFQDYDKLRSGYVTIPQFFRCLWQTLNLKLSAEEEQQLIARYGRDDKINYRLFCEDIDLGFDPRDLVKDPVSQKVEAPEFLGTKRTVRPLTRNSEESLVGLLKRMQQFYQVHGINLRTTYEDFDRHHIGVVTESQFYRNFPGPADVNEEEMKLLQEKYKDPARPGLMNYLNLHHDVLAVTDFLAAEKKMPGITQTNVDHVPLMMSPDPSLNEIFDKLRVAIFKNGIRSLEFFKDHDKLRSGIITENQFICGLVLAAGKEAQLSRAEIQKIVEFYRVPDGRVRYREFCDMLENTFTIPDLEKKPTEEVSRPLRGTLFRGLKPLATERDEDRLQTVLNELREKCRRQRLMMYPYFKDYDRSKAYSRVVTPLQFGRILHFLGMNVNPEDLKLLLAKFQDPATGDVNYPAFVQAVDEEFVGHTMDDVSIADETRTNQGVPERQIPDVAVSFEDLMARIRHIVLVNRYRVIEFFQDFDPLRSGAISKTRFRRCLSALGLSKIQHHDLNDSQFVMLCKVYQHPTKQDQVLYSKFVADVESVFTQAGLEKQPTANVPPQEIFRVPKPGTVDWQEADPNHVDLYEATMDRIRSRVEQRRVLLKPVFQDFDKHNNGHVTRMKFRQALTMVEIPISEPEMHALEGRFYNDMGVNYLAFLQALQPVDPPEYMYVKRMEEVRATNDKKALPELYAEGDLEKILLKIKTKVSKERIRVEDFMKDYDKLRSGRMLKTSFRRAVTLARLDLYESELAMIEDKYQSAHDPDYIDYKRFCDEIESIFTTKELEKTPLEQVDQFKPPVEWELNALKPEQAEKFMRCMTKIKEKVRKHRMQLFPLFEDFDRVHNGYVSKSQFHRVLSELELESMITFEEFELLSQQFQVRVGGKTDINYIAFCEMVYHMAGFEWRKP
ncbi:hypothetical protein BaRGS_00001394 [Batillaria attramentaria]|uniref:EF-hand domain-containing protein n=1 Tax=Batillaria attramentaria TaxID=370345 RepID=A0ABD0M7S5_9CAEN